MNAPNSALQLREHILGLVAEYATLANPPVTFIAYWPYILLPGFLVPLAWLLHAASLIQLRRSA